MDDDDHGFSDPELDDLPVNTLLEYETAAIRATQNQSAPAPESTYGSDEDDEVVNLDDAGAPSRFAIGAKDSGYHAAYAGNAPNDYGEPMEVEEEVQEPPLQSQANMEAVLQRLKKVEQDRRHALTTAETAQARLSLKSGEADNLRRRNDAERREAEKRRAEQERAFTQQTEQLKAERDELARQLELTKTNNEFDKHEARQENHSRRPRNIPSRPRAAPPVVGSPTPKKAQKNIILGDGFDDEDIVMASPTKRREKSKAATPKQTSKRKRMLTNDSPIAPLQLSEPREPPKPSEPVPAIQDQLDIAVLRNIWKDDSRFTLVQRLLSHRRSRGSDRVFEALVQYAFPSQPLTKLSSIVYDSLSSCHLASDVHELALRICRIFLQLWKQCLQEKYYAPVYLLIDALQFVLACSSSKTAVELTEETVPIITDSIMLVATPIYEAGTNMDARKISALFSPAQRLVASEINTRDCFELLYLLATSAIASPDPDTVTRFWRTVPFPAVLALLKKWQPLHHITMILRILSTSALPNTIGPIHPKDPAEQQRYEVFLVVNLTELLSAKLTPVPDPQDTSPALTTEAETFNLRLQVLAVLTRFSIPAHGATLLAHHKNCIGRLITFLNASLSALYAHPLSPTQPLKIASVNKTMRLLHHLYSSTNVQIKAKLEGTIGGQHAFHVSMTRLAFSEGLVLEEGIEAEVCDMAHDILNDGMGPEEGEELMRVFPSGNSG
jgi:hypothetical protein